MISRYEVFCKVIQCGSFTKVAEQLGYSQSAISQIIKSLEQEIGTVLIDRKKDGITLTVDGEQFLPYLQTVFRAEEALSLKKQEVQGLENSVVRIGTFTSVSRTLLPAIIKEFKREYPNVTFILRQGEYTSIGQWIQEGSVDLGFVNTQAVSKIEVHPLYQDEMWAVLPMHHLLSREKSISLSKLAQEPFILLDEGEYSVTMNAFEECSIAPRIEYEVYDDYTILAMVRQELGVSAMYRTVLKGFENGLAIRAIVEKPKRTVALAWRNWKTLSFASRRFAEFAMECARRQNFTPLMDLTL